MTTLWNTERVRAELGAASIRSASRTLHRLGVAPVAREPGRSGMNLYDAGEVTTAIARMPRRGQPGATPGAEHGPRPTAAIRNGVAGNSD